MEGLRGGPRDWWSYSAIAKDPSRSSVLHLAIISKSLHHVKLTPHFSFHSTNMLFQSTRFPSPLAQLLRQTSRPISKPSPFFRSSAFPNRSLCTATPTYTNQSTSFLSSYRLALFAALPVSALTLANLNESKVIRCASDRSYATSPVAAAAGGAGSEYKEAESMLNLRDLGVRFKNSPLHRSIRPADAGEFGTLQFGTVSGICVGVFVKKGLRVRLLISLTAFKRVTDDLVQAAAFLLGGVFVLMQYMSSRSLININWNALTSSYDSLITSRAGPPASQGGNRAKGLWMWFIDFVGADVQSRATFVAGVLLGLRIG